MLAAFCPSPGRIELREVPRPEPGPTDVLVRVRSCGICGSDLHYYHGALPCPPVCPGHEIAGEIAELGKDVRGPAPGDRVAVEPVRICGACPYCLVGDYQLCRNLRLLGIQEDGGFAEFVRVPARSVFRLPSGCDWFVGALAEPASVALHGVRLAGVRLGQRVLVLGGGTIGLLAALAARSAGASEVLVTVRYPQQAEAARSLGAVPFTDEQEGELLAYAADNPVDAVIETVGGKANTLSQALFAVRPGGCVSVLGVFPEPVAIQALVLMAKEVRVVGSMIYGRTGPRADFEIALELLDRHRDTVRAWVTHRFPLDRIAEGFATASDKKAGSIKVAIHPPD
ncbi:MAG: iditol 2-dehydrogenase [Candidatus Binatia bacterium]|nr:MAG: iditol 2-dehydrogenase [Candidatus Binatia bacterium]